MTFESPDQLADGVIQGPVQLRYSGAGGAPDTTLLLGTSHYENDPSVELDPMTLQATFAAVPAQVDAYLRIDLRPLKEGTYAGRARQLVEAPRSTTHVWASATQLPRVVDIQLRKPGARDVTANYAGFSAPGASRGSAGIGTLHAKVATAEAAVAPEFIEPAPDQPENYAAQHAFIQTGDNDEVLADLRLDGLAVTDVMFTDPTTASGDEKVDAHVEGVGDDRFVASVKTETLDAISTITPLPTKLDVLVAGDGAGAPECKPLADESAADKITCIDYTTGGGVLPTAATTVRTAKGLVATGTVTDMPAYAVVRLNETRSTLDYTADTRVPKVIALVSTPVAELRSPGETEDPILGVDATLTEVPTSFELSYASGLISFDTGDGTAVDSITAKAALVKNKARSTS